MSSADIALQRAHAYLEEARDLSQNISSRCEAFDASRSALLDARRAGVSADQILPIFTAICTTAIADSSRVIRGVVPQAVEDLCLRDMRSFIPAATSFMIRSLHDDSVPVIKRALRTLTSLFRKLIGFVVSVGVSEETFPESRLSVWFQMQQKAISFIHAEDEGLRKAAIKFSETVVLAFSYSGSAGSPDHFTLDYILKKGTTSPLLNLNKMEEEGVRCVRCVAEFTHFCLEGNMWTSKPEKGRVAGLPPASFMTAIAVLSNLVRRRKKIIEVTLPPLLMVVSAVTGSGRLPSSAFLSLSDGQKQSIVQVLRFSVRSLRAYPHARQGRAGSDITLATNDLEKYEREVEANRQESGQKRNQSAESVVAPKIEQEPQVSQQVPRPTLKRPRSQNSSEPWRRLPADEAHKFVQSFTRGMPHEEVVNFIMTRLLLNIPPAESVPGAIKAQQIQNASLARSDEPTPKRPRKGKSGVKETDRSSTAAPKKVAPVRKLAPPVVPVHLSPKATEKLVTICCRRVLKREAQAVSSGAGPLRLQILARLLAELAERKSDIASTFCDEACIYIVDNIENNIPLAQAWLYSLVFREQFSEYHDTSGTAAKVAALPEPTSSEDPVLTQSTELTMEQSPPEEIGVVVEMEKANGRGNHNAEVKSEQKIGSIEVDGPIDGERQSGDSPINEAAEANRTRDLVSKPISGEECEEEEEEEPYEPLRAGEGYERILRKLLTLLRDKNDISAEAFSRMVIDAPILSLSVMELLESLCKDPSRTKLGLQTLRDVIVERSGKDRRTSLSLLLGFAAHDDEVLRGPAIRLLANKIYVECQGEVSEIIEGHAADCLEKAFAELSGSATDDEISALDRGSLLLTALCGQKHTLLGTIASFYAKAPDAGKQVLLRRAKDLAGHIGMSARPILDLIGGQLLPLETPDSNSDTSTDGIEGLALEVLRALLKKFGKPSEEVVEAARLRYEVRKNTDFIIAVLPGLPKQALLRYLAAVVESAMSTNTVQAESGGEGNQNNATDEGKKTSGFKDIISTLMSSRPPSVTPAELLVELHKLPPGSPVSTAIRACFEMKAIYKQEAVAQAVQQLMEMTVTPDLFMRTVHLARIFHPDLEKYLTETVMQRLIEKQVWSNALVWEGFLRYCVEIKKKSIKLLLSLPVDQLQDALRKQPVLTGLFKELVSNPKNAKKINPTHRKTIAAAIKKTSKTKK